MIVNDSQISNYSLPVWQDKTGRLSPIVRGIFKNNAELFWINYDRIGLGWYTPGDNSLFFCRDLESTDDLGDLGDISTFFSPSSQKEEVWVGAKFVREFLYQLKRIRLGIYGLRRIMVSWFVVQTAINWP